MCLKFQSYYWKRLLHKLFRTYSLYFFSMFKKYYQGYWWVIGKVILIYSVPYIFYNEFFTSGLPTSVLQSWTWKSFLLLEHLKKSTPPIFIEDLMIWWLYSWCCIAAYECPKQWMFSWEGSLHVYSKWWIWLQCQKCNYLVYHHVRCLYAYNLCLLRKILLYSFFFSNSGILNCILRTVYILQMTLHMTLINMPVFVDYVGQSDDRLYYLLF